MRNIIAVLLGSIFIVQIIGCKNSTVDPQVQLVMVRVDLQFGFGGHLVRVGFNGDEYYSSHLSESVPLAGPIATFSTYLPRGKNTLYVFWQSNDSQMGIFNEESLKIQLGDGNQYFLGIGASADSLDLILQDAPFEYI